MAKLLKIGDKYYETPRIASIKLGIPYATLTKKLRESNGDCEKLTQALDDYYKVVLDGKPYTSYAKASTQAGVPSTFLQGYVAKHGRNISIEDVNKAYKPRDRNFGSVTILGQTYSSVANASIELGVPTSWLYHEISLHGVDNLDKSIKEFGKRKRGQSVQVGDKRYTSMAKVANEYHIAEATVTNAIEQSNGDAKKLEQILSEYKDPIVLIEDTYLRTHAGIARKLDIAVSDVSDAIKDYEENGLSWEEIQNKYHTKNKKPKRETYGPFILYGHDVNSLHTISKITGLSRSIVKDSYLKYPESEDLEEELDIIGERVYGKDYYDRKGYSCLFDEAFAKGICAKELVQNDGLDSA